MEIFTQRIKRLVNYYVKLTGTRDPANIARFLGITIAILPLGNIAGNYKLINRKRWIFINEDIPVNSTFFKIVLAHELGHAIFHRKENCAFIKNQTLLLTSGIEKEANTFAAYLLLSDDLLQEYSDFTKEQLCQSTGYPRELLELRLR